MVTGFSGEYFQNPGQYTSNIHRISPEKGKCESKHCFNFSFTVKILVFEKDQKPRETRELVEPKLSLEMFLSKNTV